MRSFSHRECRRSLKSIFSYFALFSAVIIFVVSACSVPNLEKPQCTEARGVVRQFYSFHFGNDMSPSVENLRARQQFLTSELISDLSASSETRKDYFTATEDYPKAFRVGVCNAESNDKAILQVVLLWRDDIKSEQKEVKVEVLAKSGKWLINKVIVDN